MKDKVRLICFYSALALLSAPFFSGCKKAPVAHPITTTTTPIDTGLTPLKNMFGINAYEWNFLQDPADPSNVAQIYEPKMAAIENFTGVRHYLDWYQLEDGVGAYTFNPSHEGSWNMDIMYQRSKQDSLFMLVDIKSCPPWLQSTYPISLQDTWDVPAPYGSDLTNPASYIAQGKVAFQFAARYGSNTAVDPTLVTVDKTARWTNDPPNVVKIGLNTVKYVECDNERDNWWTGPKGEQTAQQYAANMSAFYDGNKGKLGKNVGVKNADPHMVVVMGGLATASTQYVQDMIDWCKINRGYKANGDIDLCFDVINYHFYANDGNVLTNVVKSVGWAPELSPAGGVADGFVKLAASIGGHPQVWVTENGYDINAASTQRAVAIGNKSVSMVQGDWIIRSALLYARHGINRLFFYQLFDDTPNSTETFGTSGLINDDLTRRPAADYIVQVKKLMGNYGYKSTLNADPLVDKYVYGAKSIYALMIPDQKGRTGSYTLDLGKSASAIIYSLKAGSNIMTQSKVNTVAGKLTISISETPVFVQGQ